jgi:hypothetical protein
MADFYDVMLFFGRYSAWLLLPAAAIIFTWVLEAKKRPEVNKEEWQRGVNISTLVKVFSFIGMIYGFFLMLGAVMMELQQSPPSSLYPTVNHFTTIVYFLTGSIMFFKPFKDVPLAALISLGLAIGVVLICMVVIPNNKLFEFVAFFDPTAVKWILGIIFIAVLAITYTLSKMAIGFLTTLSKIMSKAPFAFIFASFILVQAIMLLFGASIVAW